MDVEWDEEKREINISDHSIDFVQAGKIFENPVVERLDDRKDYGEERYIAIGHWNEEFLVVVYTWEEAIAGSFRHGRQDVMKKERITTVSRVELKNMKDRTRDDAPVGPSLGKDFWKDARVVYPDGPKEAVKVRYDRDVLEWFKAQGRGYQTRMNAVLRSYYEAHKDEPTVKR